jgi:hypothetical protein
MEGVTRSKLIDVCSTVTGKPLEATASRERVELRSGGKWVDSLPKNCGMRPNDLVPMDQAYFVLNRVVKGDPDQYRRGKQLLRV